MRRFRANSSFSGCRFPRFRLSQLVNSSQRFPRTRSRAAPHFVHRLVRRLQNVKLVVHDPALWHPRLQALPERFPHVHTSRSNHTSLKPTQVLLEKLIQRFFLTLPSKPLRFSRLQVRHYRQKLLALRQIDLIYSHLPQCGSASPLGPALEIPQIDRAHRARRQSKLPGHSSHRRALTGLPHRFLKSLAQRCLAGPQRELLRPDPTSRAAHPVQLDHHRGAVLEAGQIPYLSFVHLCNFLHCLPTPRTRPLALPTLPSHPQAHGFRIFVDFAAVDPVARPPQNLRPLTLAHPAERTEKPAARPPPSIDQSFRFLHRAVLPMAPHSSLFLSAASQTLSGAGSWS